ncbi:TonB-dependent receptor [Pseudoduganella albidiflava]|uniref:TonB-dependent receptor n=1 Tax=Pseudoduganella albidiflava TaxID=321983 RepID=A0A411WVV3_9BURK|nr:TonB-dependent receptor [Pseudoduganella albidiflava]QBI00933.1 TonB-dependent receptor [Pseudoduganella albidiflava]GGY60788.1 TonB-dependent receptor [Pseudoduganella albidiflava]
MGIKVQLRKTAIAAGVAQVAMLAASSAWAQQASAEQEAPAAAVVTVTGQRAALNSAQKIKQQSDEIVDSIVAEDIGKLPDKSVTEVLQRVVGVTIDRMLAKGDDEHFSVEGSGVSIRGLNYVRSELNGRDSFSANGGRALNFEDVPPELMAGVDVYKSPSAEQIEGAVGGLVNLRTAMPFDFKGFKFGASLDTTYSELRKDRDTPSGSVLVSHRWKTGLGEFGALIDVASSNSKVRTDGFQVDAYFPRDDVKPGSRVWVPKAAQWRTMTYDRERDGIYGALQWKLNNELKSSLTYFKSKYKIHWDENAVFASAEPYRVKPSADTVYDANGVMLVGTLETPNSTGINFGNDTRSADRESSTTDLAWNAEWRPSQAWTLSADVQRIRARTAAFDSLIATGILVPKERLDLTRGVPHITFDDADRAFLVDPKNYFWDFTMEHRDASVANETAWRTDAKYTFDHPVLRDLRFGVRMTDRDSLNTNSNPSYNWAAVSEPWMLGSQIGQLASLGDPRFAGGASLRTFPNYFNGDAPAPPPMLFPDVALTTGYPGSYAKLHSYHEILCAEFGSTCQPWKPAEWGTNPAGINRQEEKTKALYTQLRFGWDDLPYPVDGNVGVRYVRTNMKAAGYVTFTPPANLVPPGYTVIGPAVPQIPAYAEARDYERSYGNVLPSLNLRMKVNDRLQLRLAFSKGISRPDFSQLQGYTSLSQSITASPDAASQQLVVSSNNLTGTASGNPYLKPVSSKQLDLTAEYYWSQVGSFTVALFNKDLKDIIIKQLSTFTVDDTSGNPQEFVVDSPVNGAKGRARGIELAYQQYFDQLSDMLPGWLSGFGVQANFTYVDSEKDLYNPVFQEYCSGGSTQSNLNMALNGCDTDGRTFGNLPLEGLSKRAANLAFMYDKGPWSARVAYAWRSKSLLTASGTRGGEALDTNPASPTFGQRNLNWSLPVWTDQYGQVDASLFYKINEHMTFGLEGTNLTDAIFRQVMQQHIGMKGRAWFASGPRYSAKLRVNF